MSDVTTDLRWTHFQPSAQAQSHHYSSPVTVEKTQALTVFGRWHLVRENAICIRHNPICLQWIGVCVRVCVPDCASVCVCVYVWRCSRKTERGESQWDRLALGWHTVRQTHFITGLFTWLTGLLYQPHSTLQHTTVSNTPKSSPPTPTQIDSHIVYKHKAWLADWLFEWLTGLQNRGSAHGFPSLGRVSGRHQIYLPVALN